LRCEFFCYFGAANDHAAGRALLYSGKMELAHGFNLTLGRGVMQELPFSRNTRAAENGHPDRR
jgi:hypothetical protein